MTLYRTIVADPPWSYGRDEARFPSMPGRPGTERPRIDTSIGYDTLTVEEIAALPVRALAGDDCRLFLWTTSRHLPAAFDVLEVWGFEYRQTLVWHKTGDATPFGGSVAPNHAEFLLVAQVGFPPVVSRAASSVIACHRSRRHSAKPEAFLDVVEQVSPGPYLEMFARRARFGWDYWGDESLGTAELPSEAA